MPARWAAQIKILKHFDNIGTAAFNGRLRSTAMLNSESSSWPGFHFGDTETAGQGAGWEAAEAPQNYFTRLKISSLKKSIDTDFAINSISCECSLGPSRNPAQWRVSSHPVTVTTAAQPRTGHGKYFLKTSPKYFWVLWRILSQNLGWADHRSQPQVRVQSVQYNTLIQNYRYTTSTTADTQPQTFTVYQAKCSELKSFLQEGYLCGAIISL